MSVRVDLRVQATTVKDQGLRGTCVACAATAAHEMVRAEGVEFSIEYLHWASKRRDGLPPDIEGTTLFAASESLIQDGQPLETTWPYDDTRNQFSVDYQPPLDAVAEASHRRINGVEMLNPTSVPVRNALDHGRLIVLGVQIFATWHHAGTDGRIAMPSLGEPNLGGHAILVVGHGADDFVVQNSWGSDWGDNGFGYISDSYLDTFAIAAWSVEL